MPRSRADIDRDAALRRLAQGEPLTVPEVAALWRVGPKAVHQWVKAGKLTSFRTLGGRIRFEAEVVREMLRVATSMRSES